MSLNRRGFEESNQDSFHEKEQEIETEGGERGQQGGKQQAEQGYISDSLSVHPISIDPDCSTSWLSEDTSAASDRQLAELRDTFKTALTNSINTSPCKSDNEEAGGRERYGSPVDSRSYDFTRDNTFNVSQNQKDGEEEEVEKHGSQNKQDGEVEMERHGSPVDPRMLHQYSRHEPSTKTFDVPESKIPKEQSEPKMRDGTGVDPMYGFLDVDHIFADSSIHEENDSKQKPEGKIGTIASFRRKNTHKAPKIYSKKVLSAGSPVDPMYGYSSQVGESNFPVAVPRKSFDQKYSISENKNALMDFDARSAHFSAITMDNSRFSSITMDNSRTVEDRARGTSPDLESAKQEGTSVDINNKASGDYVIYTKGYLKPTISSKERGRSTPMKDIPSYNFKVTPYRSMPSEAFTSFRKESTGISSGRSTPFIPGSSSGRNTPYSAGSGRNTPFYSGSGRNTPTYDASPRRSTPTNFSRRFQGSPLLYRPSYTGDMSTNKVADRSNSSNDVSYDAGATPIRNPIYATVSSKVNSFRTSLTKGSQNSSSGGNSTGGNSSGDNKFKLLLDKNLNKSVTKGTSKSMSISTRGVARGSKQNPVTQHPKERREKESKSQMPDVAEGQRERKNQTRAGCNSIRLPKHNSVSERQTPKPSQQGVQGRMKQMFIPLEKKGDKNLNATELCKKGLSEQGMWERVDDIFDQVIDVGVPLYDIEMCFGEYNESTEHHHHKYHCEQKSKKPEHKDSVSMINTEIERRSEEYKEKGTHKPKKSIMNLTNHKHSLTTPKPQQKSIYTTHQQSIIDQMNCRWNTKTASIPKPQKTKKPNNKSNTSNNQPASSESSSSLTDGSQGKQPSDVPKKLILSRARQLSTYSFNENPEDHSITIPQSTGSASRISRSERSTSSDQKRRGTTTSRRYSHFYVESNFSNEKSTTRSAREIWTSLKKGKYTNNHLTDKQIRRLIGMSGTSLEDNNIPGWRYQRSCVAIGEMIFTPIIRTKTTHKDQHENVHQRQLTAAELSVNSRIYMALRSTPAGYL